MTIHEQISADCIAAMKARKEPDLGTLRLMKAEILKKEKEVGVEVNDSVITQVLRSMVKKYKDSIDAYSKAGREDLVRQEQGELAVVQRYLPAQMSQDAVRGEILAIIDTLSDEEKSDFGVVMGRVMSKLKGKADGSGVQKIVKELLG